MASSEIVISTTIDNRK